MPTKRTPPKPKPSVKNKATTAASPYAASKRVQAKKPQPKKPSINQARKKVTSKQKTASHSLVYKQQKRIRVICVIAALIVLCVGIAVGVDYSRYANRAYPGVYIGDIAVGDKTADEIGQLVSQRYADKLPGVPIAVYATEEALTQANPDDVYQQALLAEQISAEEAQSSKQVWYSTTDDLQASIDVSSLVDQALAVGRSNGGFSTRLEAAQTSYTVPVGIDYNQDALQAFVDSINATLGTPTVESGITVENGVASPFAGQDGYLVLPESFSQELTEHLLDVDSEAISLVANLEDAPLHITYEQASTTADEVTRALNGGAVFQSNNAEVSFSGTDLGSWVTTTAQNTDAGWVLQPAIDPDKAHDAIIAEAYQFGYEKPSSIHFVDTDSDEVKVESDQSASLPVTSVAISSLNEALFGADGKAYSQTDQAASAVAIELLFESVTDAFSIEDAIDHGLICVISSYTTTYNTDVGTENRNHNIELVSSLLNNSVIPAQRQWSFNETAGECNEAAGFLDAGAIVDGEYASEFGGGICQVATTIFNAVFESGFPIDRRYNHSLYIASYPAGRDAAVSWPDLDLQWTNDSNSEVLLSVTCNNGALTATLYGIDPGYQVTSETGQWEEGEEYQTRTKLDDTLAPNTSYTKTRGVDGSKISVIRTVMDEGGSLIRKDLFASVYAPVTEVVIEGPKQDEPDETEKREMPTETNTSGE